MTLTDLQMAAALCEQVYRRADNDQQLDSAEPPSSNGFGSPISNAAFVLPVGFTADNGYYYNNTTGFVAQVISTNGKIFVVYRGSDLSGSFGDALIPTLFGDPTGGGPNSSTVDVQDWANNYILGNGTSSQSQLDDALAILRANPTSEIIVTGQSLGGGLAGLAVAIENVRKETANAPGSGHQVSGIGIDASPFYHQLEMEAALLALEDHGISLATIRTWAPIDYPVDYDLLGCDTQFPASPQPPATPSPPHPQSPLRMPQPPQSPMSSSPTTKSKLNI
jgi:Lipase (class 3)